MPMFYENLCLQKIVPWNAYGIGNQFRPLNLDSDLSHLNAWIKS